MTRRILATLGLLAALSGRASAETLNVDLTFTLGTETLQVLGEFDQTSLTRVSPTHVKVGYELDRATLQAVPSAAFSSAATTIMRNADYEATMDVVSGTHTLTITVTTNSTTTDDPYEPPATFTVTQTGSAGTWTKDEGVIKTTSTGSTGCTQIEPSGNQPIGGVYSVVLTKPASCDFKLPTVKIAQYGSNDYIDAPIGMYWKAGGELSHNFPLHPNPVKDANGSLISIDDGFILVQPNGKSYLLVDAGWFRSGGKKTQEIAENLSQSLGFGSTTLLQPDPGSPADNYATATVFQAGSVIAIYDDTPDMSGNIKVEALIDAAVELGLGLTWNAAIAP